MNRTAAPIEGWTFVARLEEIANGRKRVFTLGEHSIIVCRVYNQAYIVSNLCPHRNQPLADGRLQEYELTCPYHNACFDIRDGKALAGPSVWPLETFQSKIVDGNIFVRPNENEPPNAPADPRL